MLRGGLLIACFTAFIMLLSPVTCKPKKNYDCPPSSCGNIQNISYPFRLMADPQYCRQNISYELSCEHNRTILQIDSGRYYVEEINYNDFTMRVVDTGLQKDNCLSLPLYSWTSDNFIVSHYSLDFEKNTAIAFISCATPVNSSFYIDTSCATPVNSSSSLLLERHSYVVDGYMRLPDLVDSCSINKTVWASKDVLKNFNVSFHNIHDALVYGFHLSWWVDYYPVYYDWRHYYPQCYNGFFRRPLHVKASLQCFWNLLLGLADAISIYGSISFCISWLPSYSYYIAQNITMLILLVVAARMLCWSPCVLAILVYKWRRHLSMYDSIEEFIQRHNKLMPVRYSYSDIRKMTKGFKDKLGEGGFGSVFKGKLRSGHLVAVKILGNSKADGQDFINEVATIGRIHHVNVACLIGFCAERSKRALVYDFMPNGSLEKYIFPREEGIIFLSFEKLYAISLGIARGIEYLHQGCDMQILHFDIKPHNILLDEKFTPKVSDFGLAKLYPTDDSIVNLTAARGTMGYMAPELFYKNIGGVSYKADVYSFGMLLMEMGSKRKNLNPFVEHLSQIYFPSWVYDQFSDGKDIEMGDITEEERKIAKKMIIVAFWCIQLKPTDRPSMSKVVEMLEGNVELQMPPKPFLSPQEIPVEDHGININSTELTISSGDSTDSISLSANEIEMIQIQKSYD